MVEKAVDEPFGEYWDWDSDYPTQNLQNEKYPVISFGLGVNKVLELSLAAKIA